VSDYKIVDNFLPTEDFKAIQNIFLTKDGEFPWYFIESVSGLSDDTDCYFEHHFYDMCTVHSNWFEAIKTFILPRMDMMSLIRCKANLFPQTKELHRYKMHTDQDTPHKGAVYSLNTCNGFTVLEDGTEIKSVANRMLFFDSSELHGSTSCTDANRRVNFNFNFL